MTTITYIAQHGAVVDSIAKGAWCGEDSTTDLSGNSNTMTEVGTLSIAETTADGPLIQHTGFSAANYLQRAYDADFDFDGHTLMAWINVGTVSTVETIIDRQDTGGSGARFGLYLHSDGTLRSVIDDGVDTVVAQGTTDLNDAGWVHVAVTWDATQTQTLYINGAVEKIDTTGSAVGSLANGTAVLRIGLTATGSNPCDQGISLAKVYDFSAESTSIALVYNSEKTMYLNGGQYTTYGLSTQVTFPVMELSRNVTGIRSVATSIGGSRQVLFDRDDVMWTVTTSELRGAASKDVDVMLQALIQGSAFSFDAYDTDELVSANLHSDKYTGSRIETSDYFAYNFTVIEE